MDNLAILEEKFEQMSFLKEEKYELLPLQEYDVIIVNFSGGKDSGASVLYLLDRNVPPHKIWLWHQEVYGRGKLFLDWPCTTRYCELFAQKFGLRIAFQWREGGFKRQMLRQNAKTADVHSSMTEKWLHCHLRIRGMKTHA